MTAAFLSRSGPLFRPATVRGRLLLLMLLAAVPVICMAGFIAWQNYRTAAGQADNRLLVAAEAALVRYDSIVDDAARALRQLAQAPVLATGGPMCDEELRRAQATLTDEIDSLSFVATTGGLVCTSTAALAGRQASGVDPSLLIDVLAATEFVITSVPRGAAFNHGGGDASMMRAILPVERAGRRAGALVAGLNLASLIRPVRSKPIDERHAWLTDRTGAVLAAAVPADSALPMPETLAATAGNVEPVIADSRSGALFAYVAAPVGPDLRLLVATPAAGDVDRARRLLVRRVVELGVLVLAGLGLIAVGANVAVVDPLNRLTQAVRAWRVRGGFDPAMHGGPSELHELAGAFGEAVAALAEREAMLRAATARQELLMQEIHHRVKNNLQIIASLLNLQASRIRQPEARVEFQSARDRIRALATLHRHLYAYGELHTINMRGFLAELCGQLLQAFGEAPRGGTDNRIRLDIEAVDLQISSDQAVPMALIVTETVSNAARYAFPDGRRGTINIRLTTEGEMVRLVIEDDGVGIPAGRAETESGVRDGIGIQLIRGFARQLGATLLVTEETGTRYDLTLRLRLEAAGPGAALSEHADHAGSSSGAGVPGRRVEL